ncbi:RpiR family transcriptional regulator, partial [Streptomyces sp. SID4926]|nr:RpiR family transcriptional regulator [Streptomyces sp. SID4926]
MTKDVKDFANGASALSRPAAGPGRAARPAAASTPAPAASHRA